MPVTSIRLARWARATGSGSKSGHGRVAIGISTDKTLEKDALITIDKVGRGLFLLRAADRAGPDIRLTSAQFFFVYAMLVIVLGLQILAIASAGNGTALDCQPQESAGYDSPNGCTFLNIQAGPLRVIYMDEQYVTQNPAAIAKVQSLGMNYSFGETCDDPNTAVAEW